MSISCFVRSGVSGKALRSCRALRKFAIASTLAECRERALPGLEPVSNGHLVIPRFLIVKGEDFGLIFNQPREVVLQNCRDVCVDLLSFAFEQESRRSRHATKHV